jgi:transposase
MRCSGSDKAAIQLLQNSNLSIKKTLERLNIHKPTFYNWLKRYQENGIDGPEDRKPAPKPTWNKITEEHRDSVIELALDKPDLSPREIAVSHTDEKDYYVSESNVCRLLKEQDLITRLAYILMQASDKFRQPATRVNEMWQSDFTYFKIIGWGWYYLSTELDDYSRFIISWRLCTSMGATDVSNTLDDALAFSGLDEVKVRHELRLLSDNGPCYISGQLSEYLTGDT